MSEDRKKIWTDQFQTRLFLRITIYWLIYQVSVYNFLFIWRVVQEGPGNPLEQYWRFFQEFAPILICFVIIVPVLALDAGRFAHRLVGPLGRFRRAMQDVADGQPVRKIKLRQGDFLGDMQEDFNRMLDSLEARGVSLLHPAEKLPQPEEQDSKLVDR